MQPASRVNISQFRLFRGISYQGMEDQGFVWMSENGVELKGRSLHDGFGGFDGSWRFWKEHLAFVLLDNVLPNTG